MPATVKLEGLDGAFDLFNQLKPLVDGALEEAVEAGGEPIRDLASRLAPINTGQLSDNIIVEKATRLGPGAARTKIGPNGRAWYGMFPELGTGRGWEGNPHPYMEPAADELWQEAAEIVSRKIGESII